MPSDAALAGLLALAYWGLVLRNILRLKRRSPKPPSLSPEKREERPLQIGWYLVIAGWLLQPAILLLLKRPPALFRPIGLLETAALDAAGVLLGVGALAGTLWCHRAMGAHWRLWIQEGKTPPCLIQSGPYARVRHPIYLFQMICLAATWLLTPAPFLGAVFLLQLLCVRRKSTGEERHLLDRLGDPYRAYCRRTGMFFPRLGKAP